MNQRINFSKRGQWVLDSHQNQYQNQMGPQFKIGYSSKNPSQNEIKKANQSLQLLKQKMYRTQKLRNKTPVKPNGYPTKKIQSQVDLPSNYRKVYKPQVSSNNNQNDQQIIDSLNQLNQRIDNNYNNKRKHNTNSFKQPQQQSSNSYAQNKQSFNNKKSNYDPYKNIRSYNNKDDPKKKIIEMYKQSLLENQARNFQGKQNFQKQNTYDTSSKYQTKPSHNDYTSKRQKVQQQNKTQYNQPKNNYQNNYGYNQYEEEDNNNERNLYQEKINNNHEDYQQQSRNKIPQKNKQMQKAKTFNSKQHYTKNLDNRQKKQKYNVKRPVPQRDISPEDDFANQSIDQSPQDENQRILQEAERLKNMKLYPCTKGCGRKFIKDVLQKHQKICAKMQKKKRKVFDSHNQRKNIDGAEMNQVKKVTNKKLKQIKQQKKAKKVPKWKVQSAQLRQQMMAARGVNVTSNNNNREVQEQNKILKQYEQSSMINCKFCGRTFNEKAGQRHVVFCEKKARENQFKQKNNKTKSKTKAKRPVKKRYQLIFFLNYIYIFFNLKFLRIYLFRCFKIHHLVKSITQLCVYFFCHILQLCISRIIQD